MDLLTLALAKKLAGSGSGGSGTPGRGIQKIEKTNTEGLVDTYTITYTDASTSTFTVTNGKDGEDASIPATAPVHYITGNSVSNPFVCADHEPGIYIFDQYEIYAVATSTDTITDNGYPLHTMDGVLNYVTKFEEALTDLTPLGIYMSYNGWNMEMIYSEMATSTGRIFRRTSDNAGELSRYPLIATAEESDTGIRNIIGTVRVGNYSQYQADSFNGSEYQFINKKLLDQYVQDNNLGESGGSLISMKVIDAGDVNALINLDDYFTMNVNTRNTYIVRGAIVDASHLQFDMEPVHFQMIGAILHVRTLDGKYFKLLRSSDGSWSFYGETNWVTEDNVLTRNNTEAYIPTNDYNPVTKIYVDTNTLSLEDLKSQEFSELNTTSKSIIGAINELLEKINALTPDDNEALLTISK